MFMLYYAPYVFLCCMFVFLCCNLINRPILQGHKKLLKTIACQLALADDSVPFKVSSSLCFLVVCQLFIVQQHLVPHFSHWNRTRVISWSICGLMLVCILRERRRNLRYTITVTYCSSLLTNCDGFEHCMAKTAPL